MLSKLYQKYEANANRKINILIFENETMKEDHDLDMVLSRPYPLKFFKGCLPQNLLCLLLNTLCQKSVKEGKFF